MIPGLGLLLSLLLLSLSIKYGVLFFLSGLLMIICSLILVIDGSFQLFSPLSSIILITIWGFVVKTIYLKYKGNIFSEDELYLTFCYILLYYMFFALGYLIRIDKWFSRLPEFKQPSSFYRSDVVSILSLLFGIILFNLLIIKWGLDPLHVIYNPLQVRLLIDNSGNMYIKQLILVCIQAPLWYSFARVVASKQSKQTYMIFSLSLLICLYITFSMGGRGLFLLNVLGLLIIYNGITKRVPVFPIIMFILVAVLFSGFYGYYRVGEELPQQSAILIESLLRRYNGLDNLVRLVNDNEAPLWRGKSFTVLALQPIPRAFFPAKPYMFSSAMTALYLPVQFSSKIISDFTGIGELYVNFRAVGVIIGAFIFGLLIRLFNTIYKSKSNTIGFSVWYPFVYISPMSWIMGGHIAATANSRFLLNTVLVVLFWKACGGQLKFRERRS